jgi:diadenylate cyclase
MFSELSWLASSGPLAWLKALVEIVLLAYLLYALLHSIRGTRAAPVLVGVLMITALYMLAGFLGLSTIRSIIGSVAPYTAIALIIIFQAEIRRSLRYLALEFAPKKRPSGAIHYEYEDVIFASTQLSQSKVGALIVVERETGLRTFIQSGVSLDARLSSDLLTSVFQRTSPLHDGAVIIQGEKVAAAACFLPLTTNPGLISSLGTRHRAAIGITEESDSLAIVISETDGRISIAAAGTIELGVTIDRLRMKLIQYFGPVVAPPRGVNAAGILVDRPEENLTLDGSAAAAASERQRSRTTG